jgi:hypothetical protein
MKKRGGTKKSLEEKIRELGIFRTDPRRLADLVMKAYEIKMIYEDPGKKTYDLYRRVRTKSDTIQLVRLLSIIKRQTKILRTRRGKTTAKEMYERNRRA